MTAVDIRIGHDHDFVITAFVGVEVITADTGAESRYHGADFRRIEHFVETGAFNVQNFTAQRQNRLGFAVASLFCGTARRISLDDKNFRQSWIFFLTIGQLARQ